MIEIEKIKEHEYFDEILTLSIEARKYLESFNWCDKVINCWLAKDWGYILSIFYFEIKPNKNSLADNFVWIVVGDIPPAYIDIETAQNELEVLETYVFLMEEWINNIKNGKSIDNCFPINVKPSLKNARMLLSRIEIIKSDLIEELRGNVSNKVVRP